MPNFKKKSANTKQEIPTTALPDIVFMLLIFFMVTTVLRETTLPVRVQFVRAVNIEKIEQKRLVSYLYIGPQAMGSNTYGETKVQIDDAIVENLTYIRRIMYDKLVEQPKLIVSLRVDTDSEMGMLMDVQQELRQAGTFQINYSTRRQE
jgi:biopolymer transport protein ExbD